MRTRSVVTFVERSVARFVALEGFDRAMALAGQAFAALLPLLIVIAAFSPTGGRDLSDRLTERFDLSGNAAASLREAVASPGAVESQASLIGVVILVISALSFTRALQRVYERAWGLPSLGVRGNEYGLFWLIGFAVYLVFTPVLGSLLPGVAGVILSLAIGSAVWLATPWVLLARRVPWPVLLPQAVITALAFAALGVASVIYVPHAVSTAAEQFGTIGVAFALLSWLFLAGLTIVASAALGAVIGETRSAWARR